MNANSQGGSALYGTHPWHWYFTEGFPQILGLHTPLFALGVWRAGQGMRVAGHPRSARALFGRFHLSRQMLWVVLWDNLFYSLNAHKELRFVLPVLPLALM